jgi:hypothetical protein
MFIRLYKIARNQFEYKGILGKILSTRQVSEQSYKTREISSRVINDYK